jgi:hypothetical protein
MSLNPKTSSTTVATVATVVIENQFEFQFVPGIVMAFVRTERYARLKFIRAFPHVF